MKEQLFEKILELYTSYNDYYSIFLKKQDEVKTSRTKLDNLDSLENVPDPEDLVNLFTDNYVDLALFSQDLQMMYNRLVYYMDLYVELFQEKLPDEIEAFYKNYKAFYPKINFIMKDGKLIESEDGILETKRQEFKNSETFKQLTKLIK